MKLLALLITALLPFSAQAWTGYDYESDTAVNIGQGNLVRSGERITIYDSEHGEYHSVVVQSVSGTSPGARVTVYDPEVDDYRVLYMQ